MSTVSMETFVTSDKHWILHKYEQDIFSLRKQLESFNLGSRFYFQNEIQLKKKMSHWNRQENDRLSR